MCGLHVFLLSEKDARGTYVSRMCVRQSCFERGFELNSNLNLNHKSLGLGTKLMGLKRSVIQIRSRVKLVTPRPLEERRLSTNAFLEGRAHEELLMLNEV
jgi:hypothetical protein